MKTRSDPNSVANIWPIDQCNAGTNSPLPTPCRHINPRIRSVMQNYEHSPPSRPVSVIGSMMGLSLDSLDVLTPTNTKA